MSESCPGIQAGLLDSQLKPTHTGVACSHLALQLAEGRGSLSTQGQGSAQGKPLRASREEFHSIPNRPVVDGMAVSLRSGVEVLPLQCDSTRGWGWIRS